MSYKILRNIDIDLSDPKSIDRAIREVRELKERLRESMDELIEKLATEGVHVAKMQIAALDAVDTGELERSVFGYFDPEYRIGYIVANTTYAFFVEYGTGPVGEANQHPWANVTGYHYNVGDHIGVDPRHPERGEGWYYVDTDEVGNGDGRLHWTSGQPARPFMYNTLQWLKEAAAQFGQEILMQQ